MGDLLSTLVVGLWPHVVLVVLVAWQATRTRSVGQAAGVAAVAAIVATAAYALIRGGTGPAPLPVQLAVLVVSALPLEAAALASHGMRRREPPILPIAIGIVIGLALLAPMLIMQITLNCALAGLCP